MRPEKQLLLDEITQNIEESPAFVLMRYQGLTANAAGELRNQLAKEGCRPLMVRKRVLMRAAEAANIELKQEHLEGHVSVCFMGEDPVSATKALFRFGKENGKAVDVLGGRFDGTMYSKEQVKALSELPSIEQLRAELVGVLEASMTHTVGAMEALLSAVVYCIENKIDLEQGNET